MYYDKPHCYDINVVAMQGTNIAVVNDSIDKFLKSELVEPSMATIMRNNRQFQQAMAEQREDMRADSSSFRARQAEHLNTNDDLVRLASYKKVNR